MKLSCLLFLFYAVSSLAVAPAALITSKPDPDVPEAVEQQYGQLVGHWSCTGENRQSDGSWQQTPGKAIWSWYYILDGYAVQDVWRPSPQAGTSAAMGTNLRSYDPDTKTWNVVWTTTSNATLEHYRSAYRNDELHIYAERPASNTWPSHLMHITFYNISDSHFDWKYETSGLTDGKNWTEFSRLSCDRFEPES